MKKIKFLLTALVLAVSFSSCQKELQDGKNNPQAGGKTLFTATVEALKNGADAETTNDFWSPGDKIKVVFSDNSAISANLIAGQGTADGSFMATVPAGKTATYAVYPESAFDSADGEGLKLNVPSAQSGYLADCKAAAGVVGVGMENLDRSYSPVDVPLIRYADVLLSLAEALNEQNKTAEAVKYVNEVRNRAGIALLNSNSYTTVAGQDDMRDRIRREKRWELACEGTLYFDELRWGTWYDVKLYEGAGVKECWGQNVVTWTKNGDHYTKWPIPATERQLNTSLTQNDGWVD